VGKLARLIEDRLRYLRYTRGSKKHRKLIFSFNFFKFFFAEVEAGMRKQEKQQHEKIRALQASVAALQQDKAQVVRT
jgi:hypothetical protein